MNPKLKKTETAWDVKVREPDRIGGEVPYGWCTTTYSNAAMARAAFDAQKAEGEADAKLVLRTRTTVVTETVTTLDECNP